MWGRRLITSKADGQVNIWNFSNGQPLKDLMSAEIKPKVDYQAQAQKADKKGMKGKKGKGKSKVKTQGSTTENADQSNSMTVHCKPKVDTEITCLISIYDSEVKLSNYLNEHPRVKNPCFLAVGWDKKLHIWDDPALKNDNGPEG